MANKLVSWIGQNGLTWIGPSGRYYEFRPQSTGDNITEVAEEDIPTLQANYTTGGCCSRPRKPLAQVID